MAVPVIAARAQSTSSGATVSSLNITLPSGTVAGTHIWLFPGSDAGSLPTFTATNFTEYFFVGSEASDSYITAMAGEVSAAQVSQGYVTVNTSVSAQMFGFSLRITGADETSPIHGTPKKNVVVKSFILGTGPDSSMTTIDDCLMVALVSGDGGDMAPWAVSTSGGGHWDGATVYEEQSGTGGNDASGAYATINRPTSGTVDSVLWTANSSDGIGAGYFAIAPATSAARDVTTIPEVIAVTENDATVVTNVPREVGCTSEAIAVTENDATINIGIPRVVTGIPEAIAVTENDSAITLTRDVATDPEAIAVIESDSTIDTNVPRVVSGIPESIAVTESDATVNRARGVSTDPELVSVAPGLYWETAHFNADVSGPTDLGVQNWTDEANAFDGNDSTFAHGVPPDGSADGIEATGISDIVLPDPNPLTQYRFKALVTDDGSGTGASRMAVTLYEGTGEPIASHLHYASQGLGWTNWDVVDWAEFTGPGYPITQARLDALRAKAYISDYKSVVLTGDLYKIEIRLSDGVNALVNRSRNVGCIPKSIAVVENDATVETGVSIPRDVVCTPEAIAVTESDATINRERGVNGIPEAILLTENDSTISITREVATAPEVIAVTENDATVFTGTNLDVTAIPEVIAVIENDATVNSSRIVTGVSESIYAGTPITNDVYVMDGNQVITDVFSAWTADADAFDGSTATFAYTVTEGTSSTNALVGKGHAGPTVGGDITAANFRFRGSCGGTGTPLLYAELFDGVDSLSLASMTGGARWTTWGSVSTPSGGWSWTTLNDLEVRFYADDPTGDLSTTRAMGAEIDVFTKVEAEVNTSRVVNCIPKSIAVIENNASVVSDVQVNCSPEVIAVTESDAIINRARGVNGLAEAINVIENVSQVTTGTNLDVTCSPEVIAVTESDALINGSRNILSTPEVIALTENPALIALDRTVTGIPESIQVTELLATIIRGVSVTRRIMIVS